MKKWILIFLVFSQAHAAGVDFSVERSTSMGLDKIQIRQVGADYEILKTSNYFDTKDDFRLGKFRPQQKSLALEIIKELEAVALQLNQANDRLEGLGTTFNELNSNSNPHAPFFKLNDFIVKEGSILFPRLQALGHKLSNLELLINEGVELDKERKNYVFFKDGKEIKKEEFNARFFCESPRFPTRCLAREWGALYLE